MKFLFSLFLVLSCFAADTPPDNQNIVIYRADNNSDLVKYAEFFEETERFDSYLYDPENSLPQNPFGSYLMFANHELVGIVSLMESWFIDDSAEIMTDILENHQGKGLGTILRKYAIQKTMENPKLIHFIISHNEWRWAENIESTRSALKCGFKIYSLSQNCLDMFLPVTDTHTDEMWPQDRVEDLLALSNIIRNPDKFDWSNTDTQEKMKSYFRNILLSLNLSLCVDQQTLCIFCQKIQTTRSGNSLNWSDTFKDILYKYIENNALSNFRETSCPQNIAQLLLLKDRTTEIKEILQGAVSTAQKITQLETYLSWDD